MATCFVICARPPGAAHRRETRGTDDARVWIEQHHDAFHRHFGGMAVAEWIQGDECVALFAEDGAAEMSAAITAFVRSCAGDLIPSTAVGVAAGNVESPSSADWVSIVDADVGAASRALAQIAVCDQVLATADACELASAEPLIGLADGAESRQLVGLRQRLDVVVAPWGDARRLEIFNLPKLRPELKLLENATADMIMGSPEVQEEISAFGRSRIDSNLKKVRRQFARNLTKAEAVERRVDKTIELKNVGELRSLAAELLLLAGELAPACNNVAQQIAQHKTENAEGVLSEAWDAVTEVLHELHIAADQWIMVIDDGVAIGQPPAWRY